MIIHATDAQVIEMAKLAVLASRPVGLGIMHHIADLKAEQIGDLEVCDGTISIDYYRGRMVKFRGRQVDDGWKFPDQVSTDYQSWSRTYQSYLMLFEAATLPDAVDPSVGIQERGPRA